MALWFSAGRRFLLFLCAFLLADKASASSSCSNIWSWLFRGAPTSPEKGHKAFDPKNLEGMTFIRHMNGTEGGADIVRLRNGRTVAIKRLSRLRNKPTLSKIENALEEWKSLGFEIPEYLGFYSKDGEILIVQEFVPGIRIGIDPIDVNSLNVAEIDSLIEATKRACSYHPDPSPGNILYHPEKRQLVLLDVYAPPLKTPSAGIAVDIHDALIRLKSHKTLGPPPPAVEMPPARKIASETRDRVLALRRSWDRGGDSKSGLKLAEEAAKKSPQEREEFIAAMQELEAGLRIQARESEIHAREPNFPSELVDAFIESSRKKTEQADRARSIWEHAQNLAPKP